MKYKGILAKKIPWRGAPRATLLTGKNPEADAFYDAELDRRLEALYRHHGIEPELTPPRDAGAARVWDLMIALACTHVPGFALAPEPKEGRRRGRPLGKVRAGTPSHRRVFRAVEALRKTKPHLSVAAACAELKRTRSGPFAGLSVEALRGRYQSWARLIGLMRRDMDPEAKKRLRQYDW